MEKIISIEEIINLELSVLSELHGKKGSRLGVAQMLNQLSGYGGYDGYKIKTEKHEYHLLISNGQSCCECWGYFESNDNTNDFIGSNLFDVKFTDTALNTKKLNESEYYDDCGGIQFVDFETDKGILQFAVYNAHNGFYGHDIIFAKDDEILLSDVL